MNDKKKKKKHAKPVLNEWTMEFTINCLEILTYPKDNVESKD